MAGERPDQEKVFEGCVCFQDEHHSDCPAIGKGNCHYQSLYSSVRVSDLNKEKRERREKPVRMSDLNRIVDKTGIINPNLSEPLKAPQPEQTSKTNDFDKNTPESLRNLRWEIYDLIERYDGDYGRTISSILRQEVERLFKEYTNS
jgi:hypothetical protein